MLSLGLAAGRATPTRDGTDDGAAWVLAAAAAQTVDPSGGAAGRRVEMARPAVRATGPTARRAVRRGRGPAPRAKFNLARCTENRRAAAQR